MNKVGTLRRYVNHFNLEEAMTSNAGSKEALLPAVSKHFSSQVISDEQDTVLRFLVTLRKRKLLDDPQVFSSTATAGIGRKRQATTAPKRSIT